MLVGLGGVASAESGDGSLSVGTGYAHEGVEVLIWATEHMGYESPADLQKTGVLVIRFILRALMGMTEQECGLNYGDVFDPYGPHRWVTEWTGEDLEGLEWVADHYCISPAQAQAFGGILFENCTFTGNPTGFPVYFKLLSKKHIKTCIKIDMTHQTLLKPI